MKAYLIFDDRKRCTQVDEKMRCARCGYSVGGHAASCAAKRIATMIGGENV